MIYIYLIFIDKPQTSAVVYGGICIGPSFVVRLPRPRFIYGRRSLPSKKELVYLGEANLII
jgi:hypothetical protein